MNANSLHPSDPSPESSDPKALMVDKPGDNSGGHQHPDHPGKVPVTVDGVVKYVKKGKYLVSEFKVEVGVAADLELDQVVDGEFQALADDAELHIKGGEVFISHVRQGGSS